LLVAGAPLAEADLYEARQVLCHVDLSEIEVSPDGSHIYAAEDDGVVAFARDPGNGDISFVEFVFDGHRDFEGLAGVSDLELSHDGLHVYVSAFSGDALTVLARDLVTGKLTYVETLQDGMGGVTGLTDPWNLAVSSDGNHVYVIASPGQEEGTIAAFEREPASGRLTFAQVLTQGVGGVDGLYYPMSLAASPEGNHVYVIGALGTLAVFARAPASGELTFQEVEQDGNVGGEFLRWGMTLSDDGTHLYAAGYWWINVFERDPVSGSLTLAQMVEDNTGGVDGIYGVTGMAISPDGGHLYATSTWESALTVFTRDPAAGQLGFVECEKDGVAGADGLRYAYSVGLSADGGQVFTGGDSDGMGEFARDSETGEVDFRHTHGGRSYFGLLGVRSVTLSPQGDHLYAAGQGSDAVPHFARDQTTGELTLSGMQRDGVGGVETLDGASSVVVSHDGAHVYAAADRDNALTVFARDQMTGVLVLVEAHADGVAGVDGLAGVAAVVMSPDDRHVYTAASVDSAVAGFAREPVTGSLTFVELEQDGVGGVDGLAGARALTLFRVNSDLFADGFESGNTSYWSHTEW
jgi:6-phosphogluconolactonase (cycloisomerase 2 family)